MIELPADKMDQMVKRFAMLETQMASGPDSATYVKLASEYADLEEIVGKIRDYQADTLRNGTTSTPCSPTGKPTRKCASWPRRNCRMSSSASRHLARDIQLLLLPRDEADTKNAILEIRAGTGGLEAALFAGDLFRMYERYAASRGWKVEVDLGFGRRCRRLQGNHRDRFRAAACSRG